MVLSLSGIGFAASSKDILKDISLSLDLKPSITAVIGPNGAGKSTLLKVMAGLLKPSTGSLVKEPALKVGYMPQKIDVHPWLPLSLEAFLKLGGSATALPSFKERWQISKALLQKNLRTLSCGEMRKALFWKTLLQKPDVLLLDEPTQGLDLKSETFFYQSIQSLCEEGHWIVMASHDLHVVFKHSHHIVCLNQTITSQGEPQSFSQKQLADLGPFGLYQHAHA